MARDTARDFPEDFLLGSSTAAHQVEGQNVNSDWWAWEHTPGSGSAEPSGDGIDQYHRYREDMALLASLGQRAHRLSLEWARIEPAPGEVSRAVLDHYARVLTAVGEAGMTPVVTLMHFTLPRWLAERGSWLAPDVVERFGAHVETVAGALGDLMPYACTVNEPQIVAMFGYLHGAFPPGRAEGEAFNEASRAQLEAHRAAVQALRTGAGAPRAGLCLALPDFQPAVPGDPACEAATATLRAKAVDLYVDGLLGDPATAGDFVGVQYYSRMRVHPSAPRWSAPPPEGARLTMMGWEWWPEGLARAIQTAARTGLPIVITENGIATADDDERIEYLELHLRVVKDSLDDGYDLRGYLHWSSFDNFEWLEGYGPTFGLIGIDRANGLRRVVRPSAEAFGRVCRTGRIDALRER